MYYRREKLQRANLAHPQVLVRVPLRPQIVHQGHLNQLHLNQVPKTKIKNPSGPPLTG